MECRVKPLTFDDQWEVPILEGCWVEADPSQIVGVVEPLVSSREHVHHSLHGVVWGVPIHIPVDHPLSVPHSVPGPHHATAHALQYQVGPGGAADIVAGHHHTSAAIRLTGHWKREQNVFSASPEEEMQRCKSRLHTHKKLHICCEEARHRDWNKKNKKTRREIKVLIS